MHADTRPLRNAVPTGALVALVLLAALTPPEASAQAIDNVVNSFTTAAGGWYGTLLGFAQSLFGILATITLAWAAIKWVLEGDDIKALMASLVKQIISLGFFWWVLITAPTWVPTIIASFTQAGAAAGGATALTPSSIIDQGLFIAAVIPSKVGATDLFTQPLVVIIAGLSALVILFGFIIAAAQLAITQIQAAVVLAGGVLLLGFGGSPFTRDFVQKYFSYAISTGVRLLVLYLVLGIATTEANTWGNLLLTADITDFNLTPFFVVMANAVFFAFLCWTVPKTAGEMLSGAIDMSAGAVAAGVASGAVAGAGGVLAGAAAAAPIRGALQAATAGVKAEQAAGATGAKAILGGIGRAAGAVGTEAKASASSYVGLGTKSQFANTSDTIGGRAASRLESEANKATADRAAQSATPPGATPAAAANAGAGQGAAPQPTPGESQKPASGPGPAGAATATPMPLDAAAGTPASTSSPVESVSTAATTPTTSAGAPASVESTVPFAGGVPAGASTSSPVESASSAAATPTTSAGAPASVESTVPVAGGVPAGASTSSPVESVSSAAATPATSSGTTASVESTVPFAGGVPAGASTSSPVESVSSAAATPATSSGTTASVESTVPVAGGVPAGASSTAPGAEATAPGGAPAKAAGDAAPRLPGKYQDRDLSNPLQRPDIPPDTGPAGSITIRLDDPD